MIATDTLRRLWTDRHPWALEVQKLAARPVGAYGDLGQWAHLMWVMTGDVTHARDAITRGLRGLTAEPTWGRNETRETTIEWAWRYDQLKSQMTPEERQTWLDRLFRRADLILGRDPAKPWGTRVTDSDECVGHYFGLVCIAKFTAADDFRGTVLLSDPQVAPMREAIRQYCHKARGGEFIESSEYNLGTVQLLLMGAEFAGIADYPEVAQYATEAAEQARWQMTPDYKDSVEWGDDQTPHDPHLFARVALAAMLDSRGVVERLTAGKPPSAYWINLDRALWFYDPTGTGALPEAYGLKIADGAGLVIYRQPTELIYVHQPQVLIVDHEVPYCGDYRWYKNGEWVLDHPIGYLAPANANNFPNFSGIWFAYSLFPVNRGLTGADTLPGGGFRCMGRASGSFIHGQFADPPVPFLNEWVRTVEYDGRNKLTIRDRFDGTDPTAPGMKLERYDARWTGIAAQARARLGLWETWLHCPVQPEAIANGYRWTTAGGQVVSVTATGHVRSDAVQATRAVIHLGNFHPGQLDKWVMRFAADAPQSEIVLAITVGEVAPPPSPPPPPPPPVATWAEDSRVTVQEGPNVRLDHVLMRRVP